MCAETVWLRPLLYSLTHYANNFLGFAYSDLRLKMEKGKSWHTRFFIDIYRKKNRIFEIAEICSTNIFPLLCDWCVKYGLCVYLETLGSLWYYPHNPSHTCVQFVWWVFDISCAFCSSSLSLSFSNGEEINTKQILQSPFLSVDMEHSAEDADVMHMNRR